MGTAAPVDLVIVGAGAAGLGAARAARERGVSFVVVEAMDRVGGRAFTDCETFGFAWDRGCHWLHSASTNPFTALADRYRFGYFAGEAAHRYHDGTRWASADEAAAIDAFVEGSEERLEGVGRAGEDVAVADAVDRGDPAYPWFATTIGGLWGLAPEEVSTVDLATYRATDEDWPVREGHGALVARHGAGILVTLSTPVERIVWDGPRVRVETAKGTIEAAAVVVTVLTQVVQDGVIRFDPALPVWKQEAYAALQLGNANKVAFAIDGRRLGVEGYTTVGVKLTERQGMFFQLRPFGQDLANGYLAGPLGAELERQGPAAMLDAGLTALKMLYGSEIAKHVTKSACSSWQREPWVRGAYGGTRPGMAHKRKELATPIDGKLFFAGEATSREHFSTCHGAHLSGIAAVELVAPALGRAVVPTERAAV